MKIKSTTVATSSWTALNASVIFGTAVSGIARISDSEITSDKVVHVYAQNQGGYLMALPLTIFDSSGAYETLAFSAENGRLDLYYHSFTPPSTHTYVPSANLPVKYALIQGN